MGSHARQLAEWLARRGDAELVALFEQREVSPQARWTDFFDAAEALLAASSITRILPRLTRAEAAALQGGEDADAADSLRALALLSPDGRPYPEVAALVPAEKLSPAPAPAEPSVADDTAAHAAERAFTHVAAIADVLLAAREAPLALLANGAAGATVKRRFAETETVPRGSELDDLIVCARDAGLAVAEERLLQVTERGEQWLRLGMAERWACLAEGFRAQLPRALRTSAGGWIAPGAWPSAYPWDPEWPETHAALRRRARLLGLLAEGDAEPEWALPLRRGERADPRPLHALLPAEVDKIFLQNDLSAIAPGPLAPALDVRLRTMAQRESASQASSYRFTAESVAHALALGETEESLDQFLGELSLTGIPQPLRYLISQAAARHGLVRVCLDPDSGQTRVRSEDAHLIDAMAVDQALRALGLRRQGDELRSRVGAATVFWALSDARYPATLVGARDEPIAAGRPRAAARPTAAAEPAGYATLIARLRAHHGPDADAAWLERALEAAVQAKTLLRVEVALPDGSTRALTLEATGLGGGRLRGLDRAADVERTLPVRSIRSAEPVEP